MFEILRSTKGDAMGRGVVGALALGMLTAACNSAPNEAAPAAVEASWSSLSLEHSVRRAQSELKREGLYAGRVDGIAGQQTKQAINNFQQREGLQQNGRVDQATLRRMTIIALRMDGASSATTQGDTTEESGSSMPPTGR
jgi:peptidoglycan hydrolase-like protein with peptidoglycan-binding domain